MIPTVREYLPSKPKVAHFKTYICVTLILFIYSCIGVLLSFPLFRHSEVEHLLIGSACTLFNSKVIENITNEYGNLAGYALQLLGNVYRYV